MTVQTGEIVIGVVVSRDCEDYDPSLPNISLDEVRQAVEQYGINEMILKAFGKLYRGRTACGGMGIYTDAQSVYDTVHNSSVPWANFGKVKHLWSVSGSALSDEIRHITGFVIDPMNYSDTAIQKPARPPWQDQYTPEELGHGVEEELEDIVEEVREAPKTFFGKIVKGIKSLFGKK